LGPPDRSFRCAETLKRLRENGLFRIYIPLENTHYILMIKAENI
jgi:hypothetical protein